MVNIVVCSYNLQLSDATGPGFWVFHTQPHLPIAFVNKLSYCQDFITFTIAMSKWPVLPLKMYIINKIQKLKNLNHISPFELVNKIAAVVQDKLMWYIFVVLTLWFLEKRGSGYPKFSWTVSKVGPEIVPVKIRP